MKEAVPRQGEKLTSLEGGLYLKNDLKDYIGGANDTLYTKVLKCMRVILYVQLIVFIGWASYAVWQTYRVQEASMREAVRIPVYVTQMSAGLSEAKKTNEVDVDQTNRLPEEVSTELDKQIFLTTEETNPRYEEELINDTLYASDTKDMSDKENKSVGDVIRDILTRYASSSTFNDKVSLTGSSESYSERSSMSTDLADDINENKNNQDSNDSEKFSDDTSDNSSGIYRLVDYLNDLSYSDSEMSDYSSEDTSDTLPNTSTSAPLDYWAGWDRLQTWIHCFAQENSMCRVFRYESGKMNFCERATNAKNGIYSLNCKNVENAAEIFAASISDSRATTMWPNKIQVRMILDAETNEVQICQVYAYTSYVSVVTCDDEEPGFEDLLNAEDFGSEIEEDSKESGNNSSETSEVVHEIWRIFRNNPLNSEIEVCQVNSRRLQDMKNLYNCQSRTAPLDVNKIGDPSWKTVKMTYLPYQIVSTGYHQHELKICPLDFTNRDPFELDTSLTTAAIRCISLDSYPPETEVLEDPYAYDTYRSKWSDYYTSMYSDRSIIVHKEVKSGQKITGELLLKFEGLPVQTTSITYNVRRLARYSFTPGSLLDAMEECDVWFSGGKIISIVSKTCVPVEQNKLRIRPLRTRMLIVRNTKTSKTRTCFARRAGTHVLDLECAPLNPPSETIDQWSSVADTEIDYIDARADNGYYFEYRISPDFQRSWSENESGEIATFPAESLDTKESTVEDKSFDGESTTGYYRGSSTEKQVSDEQSTAYDDDSVKNSLKSAETWTDNYGVVNATTSTEGAAAIVPFEHNMETTAASIEESPTTVGSIGVFKPYNDESTTEYYGESATEKSVPAEQLDLDFPSQFFEPPKVSKERCVVRYSLAPGLPKTYGYLEACKLREDDYGIPSISDCNRVKIPPRNYRRLEPCYGRVLVYERDTGRTLTCRAKEGSPLMEINGCDDGVDFEDNYMDMKHCGDFIVFYKNYKIFFMNTEYASKNSLKRDDMTGAIDWCAPENRVENSRRRRDVHEKIETDEEEEDREDVSKPVREGKLPDFIAQHITKSRKKEPEMIKDEEIRKTEKLYQTYRRQRLHSFFPSRECGRSWPRLRYCTNPWRYRRSLLKSPTPHRKISNDISDGNISKEEFYRNVRAKTACQKQNGEQSSVDCRRYKKWQGSKKPIY